MVLPFILL